MPRQTEAPQRPGCVRGWGTSVPIAAASRRTACAAATPHGAFRVAKRVECACLLVVLWTLPVDSLVLATMKPRSDLRPDRGHQRSGHQTGTVWKSSLPVEARAALVSSVRVARLPLKG